MLVRLGLQNFRCLREVTVDLAPLTVLIGTNDSGKTSVLDAIRLLGETMTRPVTEVFRGPNHPELLSWRREKQAIRWRIWTSRGAGEGAHDAFSYGFRLPYHVEAFSEEESPRASTSAAEGTKEGTNEGANEGTPEPWGRWPPLRLMPKRDAHHTALARLLDPGFSGAGDLLEESRERLLADLGSLVDLPRYRLIPDLLRTPCAAQPEAVLSPTGDNLVAVLDRLISGVDATRRLSLERDLQEMIPTLRGFTLRTLDDGRKSLEYILAGPSTRPITIPCENASDGALLVTAFLALAYSESPGMLMIEEPENGLHPSILRLVFGLLRKITTGEVGLGERQVILATQSPLLLNFATKEEVRIARRDLELGTTITPLEKVPDIDRLLKTFDIGELWYHFGEDGLLEEPEEPEEPSQESA